jgi:hypothetical protein
LFGQRSALLMLRQFFMHLNGSNIVKEAGWYKKAEEKGWERLQLKSFKNFFR